MASVISVVFTLVALFCIAVPLHAQPESRMELMIFPLECDVNLLDNGVNQVVQVTPETCMKEPEQPSELLEVTVPRNATAGGISQNGNAEAVRAPFLEPLREPPDRLSYRQSSPSAGGSETLPRHDALPLGPPSYVIPVVGLSVAASLALFTILSRTGVLQAIGKIRPQFWRNH